MKVGGGGCFLHGTPVTVRRMLSSTAGLKLLAACRGSTAGGFLFVSSY